MTWPATLSRLAASFETRYANVCVLQAWPCDKRASRSLQPAAFFFVSLGALRQAEAAPCRPGRCHVEGAPQRGFLALQGALSPLTEPRSTV